MKSQNLSLNQQKVLQFFESGAPVTVGDVMRHAKLPRPTAKQVLSRLHELNLITRSGMGRAVYYSLNEKNTVLDTFGNELVVVYKESSGFKKMFDQIARNLTAKDFYWAFAFKNEYASESVRELLYNFHQTLAEKKVDDRAIAPASVKKMIKQNYASIKNLQLKFISQDIPIGLIILEDAVVNLVWGDHPLAIMTKSPVIAERYRNYFLGLWNKAKK